MREKEAGGRFREDVSLAPAGDFVFYHLPRAGLRTELWVTVTGDSALA